MAARRVAVSARHGLSARETFEALSDFATLADHAEAIRGMRVEHGPGEPGLSHWEVAFRSGVLIWTQRDEFDGERMTIDFTAVEGDPEELRGQWRVEPDGDGSRVRFEADFDIGIGSFQDVLDPLAERTLRENVVAILEGRFAAIEIEP